MQESHLHGLQLLDLPNLLVHAELHGVLLRVLAWDEAGEEIVGVVDLVDVLGLLRLLWFLEALMEVLMVRVEVSQQGEAEVRVGWMECDTLGSVDVLLPSRRVILEVFQDVLVNRVS